MEKFDASKRDGLRRDDGETLALEERTGGDADVRRQAGRSLGMVDQCRQQGAADALPLMCGRNVEAVELPAQRLAGFATM